MYSIVLVDDHAIVREGFKRLIEMESDLEVIAECRCADDAVEAISQRKPDLVALDLSLPDGSGLPLIEHLRSVAAETRIVVLSMHDGEPYVSEALRRGASGYVTKGVAPEELVAGLRAVMQGEQCAPIRRSIRLIALRRASARFSCCWRLGSRPNR